MAKRWLVLKKDEEGVSPVIATILMVAITVVLAAVLYVMVSGLIGGGGTSRPTVSVITQGQGLGCTMSPPPGVCTGKIADSSTPNAVGKFKVRVFGNGTALGDAATLSTSNIAFGSTTFLYTDLGGEGNLGGGDTYKLTGVVPSTAYKISFIWSADSTQVSEALFNT
ncbi:MAG TPA: archaellin/type IV pilin N-terminal domain-containing protein [Thermoplasmata archaeon]|nr:archaellin/type IV pilin N-terminal domain-containing protein [Thermoplasmata archaeon]